MALVVEAIKSEPRVRIIEDGSINIYKWSKANDYPQKVDEIVSASGTGAACLSTYTDFINGQGFRDVNLSRLRLNSDGDTGDDLLEQAASDFAYMHGFVFHTNVDNNLNFTDLTVIPIENVRLCLPDKDEEKILQVAIYSDWGKRLNHRRAIKKIEYIDLWIDDPVYLKSRIMAAGGYDEHKGFIHFFSGDGRLIYPIPTYEASVTNMRTESAIDTVLCRNAASNFLSAGALVDIKEEELTDEQKKKRIEELKVFIGDNKALQMLYMQVKSREELPEWIPFRGENYDKEFTVSSEYAPDAIGRAFKQPPILRAVDVGGNFGAELMKNAYTAYNSITVRERQFIERAFKMIFLNWHYNNTYDVTIAPLAYNVGDSIIDKYGINTATKIHELLVDKTIPISQKETILTTLYGMDKVEVENLLQL